MRVIELNEVELAAAPEDRLLGEAREMHHEDGGRREELHDVVAVAHGIEAVVIDLLEIKLARDEGAVDGECRAGERAGAERHDVHAAVDPLEAREVPREHGEIGEQMMREEDEESARPPPLPKNGNSSAKSQPPRK